MSTYPDGSQGQKEQKQNRNMLIVFAVITVLCLLLQTNVIYTSFYGAVVKAAATGWNIAGVIFTLLSFGALYKASQAGEEGTTGYCIAWAVLLALGFFTAAGFYAGQY